MRHPPGLMSVARQIKSRCLFIVFTLHVFTLHISRWVRPLMLINIVAHYGTMRRKMGIFFRSKTKPTQSA